MQPTNNNNEERKKIEEQTRAFLERGGKITVIPYGVLKEKKKPRAPGSGKKPKAMTREQALAAFNRSKWGGGQVHPKIVAKELDMQITTLRRNMMAHGLMKPTQSEAPRDLKEYRGLATGEL